jgi:thiol-disulfide isomerase/thioredoxin
MSRLFSGASYFALFLGFAMTAAIGADIPTPLNEAIEALNKKSQNEYFEREILRTPFLAKDRQPTAVTPDEVVAAIRGWDRKKVQVADTTYRIYEQIAESKILPPGARLEFQDDWMHPGGPDKYEYRVWRIMLSVMTGKNPGYGFVIRQQQLDRRIALLAAPKYSWLVDPRPAKPAFNLISSCVLRVEEGQDGALEITAGWAIRKEIHDVRVVVFDAEGNRHLPAREPKWGGTTSEFVMARFRLDPKTRPAEQVGYVGLEAIQAEGLKLASETAVKRAKEKGIEVLPLPEVGHPYEFALTTKEGQLIDSRKLRGRVVLIDCWASWCGPCLREIPDVKKVYEKWHGKGLEVVGVSLDEDPQDAATAAKKFEIPWPLFVVPAGEEARELWNQAARIQMIPRLLVIDRKGNLHADLSSAEELEKRVSGLLKDAPQP